MTNRHLIVGLDGGTFRVIKPWVKEGKLPNIEKAMEEGVYSNLMSTIPPITGSAWSTFQTGVNPGRHGIFDWLTRKENSYELSPINSHSIKRPTLWEVLSNQGKKVGVVGVPVTYPPRPINGFMISGLLSPEEGDFTYPQSLAGELDDRVGIYKAMPEHWRGHYEVDRWYEGIKETLKARERTALYLMKEKAWDLFMVHLMETDSIQHQMWHTLDGIKRPRYDPHSPVNRPILEIYQLADKFIGKCLDVIGEDCNLLIISDHGFGSLHFNVYLNNWLRKHGFLNLRNNLPTVTKKTMEAMGLTQERIYPWLERLHLLGQGKQMKHDQIYDLTSKLFLSSHNIDWEETVAYSYGNIGQIYLNLKGREPDGVVNEKDKGPIITDISNQLEELKNPFNGERVVKQVWRKDEVYNGDNLGNAPEMLVVFNDGYMSSGSSEFLSNRIISNTFAGSGWHRMEGILVGRGPNYTSGQLSQKNDLGLADMLPTILYSMGLSIPKGLDGQVIKKLFTPQYRNKNDIHYSDSEGKEFEGEEEVERDDEEIKNRLKGLGYL